MCLPLRHKWTKWETTRRGEVRSTTHIISENRTISTGSRIVAEQERTCQKCGRLQIRIERARQ